MGYGSKTYQDSILRLSLLSNPLQKKYWSLKQAETPDLGLGDPSGKKILQDFIFLFRSTYTFAQNYPESSYGSNCVCVALDSRYGSRFPIALQGESGLLIQKEIERQDK